MSKQQACRSGSSWRMRLPWPHADTLEGWDTLRSMCRSYSRLSTQMFEYFHNGCVGLHVLDTISAQSATNLRSGSSRSEGILP